MANDGDIKGDWSLSRRAFPVSDESWVLKDKVFEAMVDGVLRKRGIGEAKAIADTEPFLGHQGNKAEAIRIQETRQMAREYIAIPQALPSFGRRRR